jgi:hypothetical protein
VGISIVKPFQPEPMDVWRLFERYKGRLTFRVGLSSQQALPYGDVHRVKAETRRLLEAGRSGGYVFASNHGTGHEVPLDNDLAMIQVLHAQPGFPGPRVGHPRENQVSSPATATPAAGMPASGYQPRDLPAYEVYRDDPGFTLAGDLLTDVCVPIRRDG